MLAKAKQPPTRTFLAGVFLLRFLESVHATFERGEIRSPPLLAHVDAEWDLRVVAVADGLAHPSAEDAVVAVADGDRKRNGQGWRNGFPCDPVSSLKRHEPQRWPVWGFSGQGGGVSRPNERIPTRGNVTGFWRKARECRVRRRSAWRSTRRASPKTCCRVVSCPSSLSCRCSASCWRPR